MRNFSISNYLSLYFNRKKSIWQETLWESYPSHVGVCDEVLESISKFHPIYLSLIICSSQVFAVTCTFAVFAYIWLFFILSVNTPDVVEVWEAFLTLAFFVILIFIAYAADKNFFQSTGKDFTQVDTGPGECCFESRKRELNVLFSSWSWTDTEFEIKILLLKK